MKRYFVIYNPSSGKELAGQKIFRISETVLEKEDVEFTFYATKKKGDAESAALRGCMEGYDMIVSCGGDGTVSEIVNGIMKSPVKTKLAILPAGTVNDFAVQLKAPNIKVCCSYRRHNSVNHYSFRMQKPIFISVHLYTIL